jgi:UDP-N-acetylmuramoylalanine--D-glutamate ligase
MNLFKNQDIDDYSIINIDDKIIDSLKGNLKSNIIPFSLANKDAATSYILDSWIYFRNEKIININEIVLPGSHNLENILAAISVAKLCGVDNKAIEKVLKTFSGVQHRLQFVKTMNSRKFYNDSKATNILATSKAINAFEGKVVLIAGGLDRGNSFDDLVGDLKNVRALICYGQTKEKLKQAGLIANVEIVSAVDSLQEAVKIAYNNSIENDVILFSPACASWDQFANFEQRGDMFVEEVNKL